MASGPNKAFASMRNAKWSLVESIPVRTYLGETSEVVLAEVRTKFPAPTYTCRINSWRCGGRGNFSRSYEVRVYHRNLEN